MALSKSPFTTPLEFSFPLPLSRDLWLAKTPADWKIKILSKPLIPSSKLPTLVDAVNDSSVLTRYLAYIDVDLASLATLYSFWTQIWTFMDLKRLYLAHSSVSSTTTSRRLALQTSQTDLYREIVLCYTSLPSPTRLLPITTMLCDFLIMSLHAPVQDLLLFAGKSGTDEAARVEVPLHAWKVTPAARRAIWHAGQVWRAARRYNQTQLKGGDAIAVFEASIVLWVYGILWSAGSTRASGNGGLHVTSLQDSAMVALNQEESRNSRAFLEFGLGTPAITRSRKDLDVPRSADTGSEVFCPLEEIESVLPLAWEIMRENFPNSGESLPPLVESLGNLMKDL